MPRESQPGLAAEGQVPASPETGGTLRLSLLAFTCSMAALALGAWHYRRFIADDAFISLRYADRFIHGHGLTWNDGEVVEGYTNLLWVLGCALLGALGLPLVWAPRVLGFLGMAAAIAAIVWVFRAPTIRGAFPGFVAAMAFALCGPVVVWSVGGLEQPLLVGLLAWALALSFPWIEETQSTAGSALLPGLFFGLAALTRADAILFAFAAFLGILLARRFSRASFQTGAVLILLPLLFFLGQIVFRRAYYHEWLPNSAYAKLGFSIRRLRDGLQYAIGGISLVGLFVPAMLAFFATRTQTARSRAVFLGIVLAAFLGYIVLVGGDQFPGRRQLVPLALPLAFLAGIAFQSWIASRTSLRGPVVAATISFLALAVCQIIDPSDVWAYTESWPWNGEPVGKLLATEFGSRRALLAVDSGGCMPYFSGLPSIDMLGINDHYLAHHHPADFGYGPLGHELGSGPYVLSRRPDLVLFNLPTGGLKPKFRSGTEMMADPRAEFRSTFVPVALECGSSKPVVSIIWMRTEGGAVGAQRSDDRVEIPGYLFATPGRARARLDKDGRLCVSLHPATGVELPKVLVSPGEWVIQIEGTGAPATLSIEKADTGGFIAGGGSGSRFSIQGSESTPVSLLLWTQEPAGAQVGEVVLERVGDDRAKEQPISR